MTSTSSATPTDRTADPGPRGALLVLSPSSFSGGPLRRRRRTGRWRRPRLRASGGERADAEQCVRGDARAARREEGGKVRSPQRQLLDDGGDATGRAAAPRELAMLSAGERPERTYNSCYRAARVSRRRHSRHTLRGAAWGDTCSLRCRSMSSMHVQSRRRAVERSRFTMNRAWRGLCRPHGRIPLRSRLQQPRHA